MLLTIKPTQNRKFIKKKIMIKIINKNKIIKKFTWYIKIAVFF